MSNSISSMNPICSWENIKETALQDKDLHADVRVSSDAVQVNAPSMWQRFKVSIGWEQAPAYASGEETLENLREQFGLDFSRKLRMLIQETGVKTDSEEYSTLVTRAMQSFDVITQKLTTTINTSRVSTSQAIQEAHLGSLNSFALLRQQFARPEFTPQFYKTGDGKWSVLQAAPHPENFVLSGGGVKGAGYVGWFKAAEQFGLLKNLKRIAGSSAGAMTAALIASGMNAEDFKKASDRTSFWSILTGTSTDPIINAATQVETKGWLSFLAFSGTYAVDHLNQEMVGSIKKYFSRFKNEAAFEREVRVILESKVQQKGIEGREKEKLIQTLTGLYQKTAPHSSYSLFGSLFQKKQPTYMVTFRDLAALTKIDSRFKELTVTGFSIKAQEEKYFNADKTPNLAIAEAVRGSMSLPVIFDPVEIDGEYIVDGGVGSNTPAEVFKESLPSTTLILQFENNGDFNQTVYKIKNEKKKEGFIRSVKEAIGDVEEKAEEAVVGNPDLSQIARSDRQKLYNAGPNAMMVAEGDLVTMSFAATPEEIRRAERQAEIRATEAFSLRQNQAVNHIFNSLEEAMNAMSSAELKNIIDFYGVAPRQYDPNYEEKAGYGDTLPISTESRRALSSMLPREDCDVIAKAAKEELAARFQ